jgi:integrase
MSTIRKKPSGKYEARYRDPAGRLRGKTFATRKDAKNFLDQTGTDIANQAWRDPALAKVRLEEYTSWWLENRPDLRPRTRELYGGLLRLHIVPELGQCRFDALTTATVRAWHAGMLRRGKPGPVTVAKAYRLLRTTLNDAVDDGLLVRNPCSIRGAGVERSAERPIATVEQVYQLADAIEPRYRAMVLLATFCGLRLGELLALRRDRIDVAHLRVIVTDQVVELTDGTRSVGPPKTAASRRVVSIPPHVIVEVEDHLREWVGPEADAPVFTAPEGGIVRRSNFRRRVWDEATRQVGVPALHFHDLRHTGNTLAASTGASTKELMARMGHSSPRAALIYQHATEERDVAIAEGLSRLVNAGLQADDDVERDDEGHVREIAEDRRR